MITLEELIENKDIIKDLGADFFNNVQIKLQHHLNFKTIIQNTILILLEHDYGICKKIQMVQGGCIMVNILSENLICTLKVGSSRSTVIVKEPFAVKKDTDGELDISLTNITGSQKTTITKNISNHNFHIDWNKINKLSVGGGSNCVIADFRLYNKILNDNDINNILDLKNADFNTAGPTFP